MQLCHGDLPFQHLGHKAAGRSERRCAAAWQRGIDLPDEHLGRLHKFAKRGPGVWSDVLLPQGADPSWRDPATLWNAVEKQEKRKDAQLARRFQVALPAELSLEQNLSLISSFIHKSLVRAGMVTDVTVRLTKADGSAHPFATVLATMRCIVCVSGIPWFGNKVTVWNDRRTLARWREEWRDEVNAALASAGHAARVDHRSMSAQEIPLEPQIHVGVVAKRRHERGLPSERVLENEEIRRTRNVSPPDHASESASQDHQA